MKFLNYSENLYDGAGEGFIFSHDSCALSFFRYPNKNNLMGIGLHVHPECDDIDILLEGEIVAYNSWSNGIRLNAPAIIANYSGVPHALVVNNQKSRVYGFRSPFRGGRVLNNKQNSNTKSADIFFPKKYKNGTTILFETDYTIGILHKNQKIINLKDSRKYKTILNLLKKTCFMNVDGKMHSLKSSSTLICKKETTLFISSRQSLLLELIAKGQNHENPYWL